LSAAQALKRAVLGVDAAWTPRQPSGVALLVEERGGWSCPLAAPSYADFVRGAGGEAVDWARPRVEGGKLDAAALLAAARRLAPGAEVLAVGVDMPLGHGPITARRPADDAISRRYGGRGCGTHSPTPERPGRLAGEVRRSFERQGFALATARRPAGPALLEVYPHTALLHLTGAGYRLPYKVARSRRYWPGEDRAGRRRLLLEEYRKILRALRREVRLEHRLPAAGEDGPLSALKRYEDAIDAVVCAWMAREFVLGRAEAVGDERAAIWVPKA
jgi:predicted RNase H-like nuclease